jgi:hypothetical protein
MANTRPTKENNFLRYEFTQEERLKMGDDLARTWARYPFTAPTTGRWSRRAR